MAHIVAIGGGEISKKETFIIDKYITNIVNKEKPNALFLPTASGDAEGYWETFQKIYGDELNCNTKGLFLIKEKYKFKEIKDLFIWADIIYVGGGDSKMMLEEWKKYKVDLLLVNFFKKNIDNKVFCGLSAGALCWFKYGNSDSMYNLTKKTIKIDCLNLVNAAFCPHFDSEPYRQKEFKKMMKSLNDCIGLAVEDNCAIHINANEKKFKIIKSNSNAKIYRFFKNKGSLLRQELSMSEGAINQIE